MGETPRFENEYGGDSEIIPAEYAVAVNQAAAEIRDEPGFTELIYIEDEQIDKQLARLIESGPELDPIVRRSLRRAVRRALGLAQE